MKYTQTQRPFGKAQAHHSVRIILMAIGFVVLHVSPALAVCRKPDPKVCAEFFKSDAVFVGTVLSEQTNVGEYPASITGWTYRLRVERVFRGPSLKAIAVFTANDSVRLRMDVGHQYLLFADHQNGQWVIADCGNSGLLSNSATKIRQIEETRKASIGRIEGRVGLYKGVGGVQVVARGSGKTFAAVTDQDGWFRLKVPPGKYSAQVEAPRVYGFDLSYDDPSDFLVPKGGCAQLQFVAVE